MPRQAPHKKGVAMVVSAHEPIPAWYELRAKNGSTLVIRIHALAMEHLRSLSLSTLPVVLDPQMSYNLPAFIEPTEPRWGFGEILVQAESGNPEWSVYECELPVLRTGKKNGGWLMPAFELRATLSILFQVLWLFEGNTGWNLPQLIIIDHLRHEEDIYGGAITATLTPAAARWLSRRPDGSRLSKVEEMMKLSDAHMWPGGMVDQYGTVFQAWCRKPKWINLSVPGDACGLDPDHHGDPDSDNGYKLSPHNTDTGLQQLTLLMGLAKLHDLMRQSP